MIILIPMGGKGSRFAEAGYSTNKACILTTDRHSGQQLPMILCAMKDIPGIDDVNNQIICVDRDFHEYNGTEDVISKHYPKTKFIHDHVLLDQAFGCFLAREFLDSDEELFIGACDNGMQLDVLEFNKAKENADVIVLSHTDDENIRENPTAHSWLKLHADSVSIEELHLKKTISDNPMNDHATTGMFWFKRAKDFLHNLEKMIWMNDTLDGKFYVDKVIQYAVQSGLRANIFDVSYICWGTPKDYENYEKTMRYWSEFIANEEAFKSRP